MQAQLIDYMGSDLRVACAARVSFNKESEWVYSGEYGEKREVDDKDQKLIKYLANHNHWTPFSHVQITLREKVPIFVARQRFKHMIGFSYNEVSRRYVDDKPEFFMPDKWRSKPVNAKQGSGDEEVKWLEIDENIVWDDPSSPLISVSIKECYDALIEHSEQLYNLMIKNEVAPEQARMVLPQSMYTEYIVTGSLAAWARAFKLRSSEHSQLEIRQLAEQWDKIISGIDDLKYSWRALTE